MADKRIRRGSRRGLTVGLALVSVAAIGWLVFGPGSGLLPWSKQDNNISRVISERFVQIYYDRDSPDTGPDGNVTIVAFLDYDSADCREVAVALGRLRDAERGVRIVFKELAEPRSDADFAARAALAADRQDGFLSLHKELIQGPLQVTESSVIMAAGLAGLDIERLRADMNDPEIAKAIEANRALARTLGVTSPTLIIGDRLYRGATDLGALRSAVAQARRRPAL